MSAIDTKTLGMIVDLADKVADAAVFGVPNEDLGEEVKAAIQLMPGVAPSACSPAAKRSLS